MAFQTTDGPTTRLPPITDFYPGAYAPKVQIPHQNRPGKTPRKLEMERRRREYLKLDIEQLLSEKGIDSNLLMAGHGTSSSEDHLTSPGQPTPPVSTYLPLEIFDNEEFECRTPDDWLALGCAEGFTDRKPIPAKALLPIDDSVPPDATDDRRLPASQYWLPRIRLLFSAEDPRRFAERFRFAQRWREDTHLRRRSADRLPAGDATPSPETHGLRRRPARPPSAPGLRLKPLQEGGGGGGGGGEERLQEGRLEDDRTVKLMNHLKLVMREPEPVLQQGSVRLPDDPSFALNRAAFTFVSLLTQPEVISTLARVRSECNRVRSMRLFQATDKPLFLEVFALSQSQTHTQVGQFLRDSWVTTLCNSITFELRDIGRGWYNLNQSQWEVYKMSKLRRLLSLVRYNLEDTLRFLVQDSLRSLDELLQDACCSVLNVPPDLVWGNDLINSPYKPRKNPLFLIDLVLDQTGVHYSTPPESFERSVVSVFDEGILATHRVPQPEKFVMKQIFFYGVPLLASVGLWEPAVRELRSRISAALRQAAVALGAYAAEYEQYLELHNAPVETLLEAQQAQLETAQEVKRGVVEHLHEKERLERSLPSRIAIGPFAVNVEAVRQALAKKRGALANAALRRFAVALRKRVDEVCERYKAISRKLYQKPDTIEELAEQRDWMEGIPEQLKSHTELLKKVLSGYALTDHFFYSLSNEDRNAKCAAVDWPQKILSQMEAVAGRHVEYEQRFHKMQLVDQNKVQERLNPLQMLGAGFTAHADVGRAHETANQVERVAEQPEESQAMTLT